MIKVTVGISGSGKSTWAKEQWEKSPLKTIVVNRDKIRELLFGYTEASISEYYSKTNIGKLEKEVTLYEDTLINEGLCQGKTVIVDATHLKMAYLERFKYWNVPIEYVYFDVTLKEALTRDMSRTRQVGKEIISKQYSNYLLVAIKKLENFVPVTLKNDQSLPHCVLVDIDGTLAHITNRSPFDWSRVGEDYVDVAVKKISNSILLNHVAAVFICTGRDGICLTETQEWLDNNNIYYNKIFIRKAGDQRPDWQIKEEIWRQITKDFYIIGMYDDRNQVTRRARALGLKVFQVEYGNF